jgi:hypothetical protein
MYIVRFQDFWEVFVVYKHATELEQLHELSQVKQANTQSCWTFPEEVPQKYKNRIIKSEQDFVWVHSLRHTEPYYACRSTLKDGLWICSDDFIPRGETFPAVFGCPLPPLNPFETSVLEQWAPSQCRIRVAYHGTSREAFCAIAASGFKSTFGMLGTGVYVGSFWKACRFAARDQLYQEREHPTVMRLLWKCNEEDILKFPRSLVDGFCLCAKCYSNPEQRVFCAHTYDWSANSSFPPPKPFYRGPWKAGQLLPCKYASGKWVTQNEEWVLNSSLIQGIAQAVQLDRTSISKPHYDPLQRNIKFI